MASLRLPCRESGRLNDGFAEATWGNFGRGLLEFALSRTCKEPWVGFGTAQPNLLQQQV